MTWTGAPDFVEPGGGGGFRYSGGLTISYLIASCLHLMMQSPQPLHFAGSMEALGFFEPVTGFISMASNLHRATHTSQPLHLSSSTTARKRLGVIRSYRRARVTGKRFSQQQSQQ